MRVETVLGGWASPRGRGEAAGAALNATGEAWCGVGDLKWEPLNALTRDLLELGMDRGSRGMGVRVHGCDAGVVLLRDEVAVLGKARGSLEHVDTGVLLRLLWWLLVRGDLVLLRMAVVLVRTAGRQAVPMPVLLLLLLLLLHVEAVHVLAKIGKGRSAMEVVTMVTHHGDALWWPLHGVASGSGGRLIAARLGHGVIDLG